MIRLALLLLVLAATLAAPALGAPVATSAGEYFALGRVFPDPLGGCQRLGTSPCSPSAQGNVPATQFIQYGEFVDALKFMNSVSEWRRYMEVLVLDGKIGEGSGTSAGEAMFPGDNLPFLEWSPKADYVSAGVPTTTLDRKKSDLIVVRVTDETVPDAGKKRMTLSLSIHGIERAGVEGGTRAMEDLVTAQTLGRAASPVVSAPVKIGAPTFADVLKRTIIYFTYPNPDGWRRGSVSEGGVFFQRYNGNGVDPNRDWPDIGYSFRPYSGGSEPETRAFLAFYRGVESTTKSGFSAGDDLHGQPFADALSFTLLPHGRHDFGKDFRLREAAKTINRAQYEATKWSPIIQPNGAPTGGTIPCSPTTTVGAVCSKIYAQTWGSVYDTINYTTTGTLGDWFDSRLGLGADGIDNEMSFSHLDRNIVFDPHGEQLHVDGNKAIIFGHLAELLNPPSATFDAPGRKGYVPNVRLTRAEQVIQDDPSRKTAPQPDYIGLQGVADPAEDGQTVIPFTVYETKHKGKDLGIYNGGLRVDVTTTNVDGIATGLVAVKLQCLHCDHHVGTEEDDGWTTVADDFNQSNIYAQAGVTVAVNRPEGSPKGTAWRAVVSLGSAVTRMDVHFTSGPATTDGATGGDQAPVLRAYDVANTDFFTDLNRFITDPAKRFQAIDPRAVVSGQQSLDTFNSIVLADSALPGYTGLFKGEPPRPSGPPTAEIAIEDTKPTAPGQTPTSCARTDATTDRHDFAIGENDGNAALTARVQWESELNDWDVYLMRKNPSSGQYEDTGKSGTNFLTTSEELELPNPPAGDYRLEVVNCSATDTNYTGLISFTPLVPVPPSTYTTAEKDAWMVRLADWVRAGGNLVLTDGALRGLSELSSLSGTAVNKQTVYTGQMTFATGSGATETSGPNTLGDPLAKDVRQPGARFNTGMRRQTFEPTPLGFAIQDAGGADSAGARQYDVGRAAWEAAGGRTAATSANSGARNAQPVFTRVTLGELKLGAGAIRIAGALLPQPSTEEDHPLGIEPYALTYTGYIVFRNLLELGG